MIPSRGITHLQKAQPVLFAHFLLAYFEMLERDRQRLSEIRGRINQLPLGSGAIAGTSFAVDRPRMAEELGFDGVTHNSIDAVSDRDYIVEFVSAAALLMVHLSRLAEDLIIYSTQEFAFIKLGDAIATGSSLMPQKRTLIHLSCFGGRRLVSSGTQPDFSLCSRDCH
jgi:argininosuccinate lyase